MCGGCVDRGEITQKVYDAIEAFSKKWPGSNYGPAHIVIDDDNVEDEHLQWCLDNWDKTVAEYWPAEGREEEYEATKAFLRELLTWPIEDRVPE